MIPNDDASNPKMQFQPNIDFWLDASNTYRVVFIQVCMQKKIICQQDSL